MMKSSHNSITHSRIFTWAVSLRSLLTTLKSNLAMFLEQDFSQKFCKYNYSIWYNNVNFVFWEINIHSSFGDIYIKIIC